MKLAIVGSRSFNDYKILCAVINPIVCFYDVTTIISGGARGADKLAKRYAEENELKLIEYIPNWDKYGKSAGYKRNLDILSECDLMVAFWDGQSKGTKHDIDIAKKLGKEFKVVMFKDGD